MTAAVIITICILLLIAYLFDVTARSTRIPSVILLLVLGWLSQNAATFFNIPVPDLSGALPVLGTIGLILIVLEGTIELELNPEKKKTIILSQIMAAAPMLAGTALIAWLLWSYHPGPPHHWRPYVLNAIPFCIISSAIAIPSSRGLGASNREFVIYESSTSDVLGILLFNFVLVNDSFGLHTYAVFGGEFLLMMAVSLAATIGLTYLLGRIRHPIKYGPIIIIVILIYGISKAYHLPGLIFIMLFGLFLGNLKQVKKLRWGKKMNYEKLNQEVHRLSELLAEAAFLIRSLFFILFGFLIQTRELLNPDSLVLAVVISGILILLRLAFLKLAGLPAAPLLYLSPRGLITILLFLSIEPADFVPGVDRSLIIQVIMISALFMMTGLLQAKNDSGASEK